MSETVNSREITSLSGLAPRPKVLGPGARDATRSTGDAGSPSAEHLARAEEWRQSGAGLRPMARTSRTLSQASSHAALSRAHLDRARDAAN